MDLLVYKIESTSRDCKPYIPWRKEEEQTAAASIPSPSSIQPLLIVLGVVKCRLVRPRERLQALEKIKCP